MNRSQRRQEERKAKADVQTPQAYPLVLDLAVEAEVMRRVERHWEKMSGVLLQVMRKNRISQERIFKITSEFKAEMKKQFININPKDKI